MVNGDLINNVECGTMQYKYSMVKDVSLRWRPNMIQSKFFK